MLLVLAAGSVKAQEVEIDYNNPKKYVVGGVAVEGNNYFSPEQIIQISGLQKGLEVTVPSEEMSSIVNRLWLQRYFEDVAVVVDSLVPTLDTAYFKISILERPRVSRWTFSGVRSGEEKDIRDRVNLKRGGEFSDYVAKTASDIIKRYYKEKGFYNVDVDVTSERDTMIRSAIRVNFAVNKGEKVKIQKITFNGAEHVKEFKLVRSMKKTRDSRLQNFFSENEPEGNYKPYDLDGTPYDEPAMHPVAITAVLGAASISSESQYADECLRRFWETPLRTGKRRYYDNCLYFFCMMMLSGQYRIYL